VGERTDLTKSRLLGSLVLEKALDLITFGGALFLLLVSLSLPGWVADPGRTLIILGLIAALGMVVLTLWGQQILGWLAPWLKKLPGNWGERLGGILERALEGFASLRSGKRLFLIWFLSLLSLLLSALTNYLVLRALNISAPAWAALFVLIVLQVGSAPPSAPGKLGVFHYLAVLALSVFGVAKDLALAYGVLLYVVALMPKIVIGTGVMIFSKWEISKIGKQLKIEN
jgi:uncharacterized protein (TIRG00374 family)